MCLVLQSQKESTLTGRDYTCQEGDRTNTDNVSERGRSQTPQAATMAAPSAGGRVLAVFRDGRAAGGLEERFLVLKGTRYDAFL